MRQTKAAGALHWRILNQSPLDFHIAFLTLRIPTTFSQLFKETL